MLMERQIYEVLNEIIDPCSEAAGAPAGLVDMGLVRTVNIEPRADKPSLRILIGVTHPMCLMAGVFLNEAKVRLEQLPDVGDVTVELDGNHIWTPADMTPAYRKNLKENRRDQIGRPT